MNKRLAKEIRMNSSEWESRATPQLRHKEVFDEDVQSIRRLNLWRRQGPITHTIRVGTLVFGYRSAEDAARGRNRFESEGHKVTVKRLKI